MKKINAEKYINWMLPFVKNEVSQANSKIGIIASTNSALLAAFLVLLGFIHTFDMQLWALITLYSVLSVLALLQFVSLFVTFWATKPKYDINHSNKAITFDESKFFTFQSISFSDFVDLFNYSSDLERKMLEQIYINGILASEKYKQCKTSLSISMPLYFFFNR